MKFSQLFSRPSPLQHLRRLHKSSLIDLGDTDERFRGVFSPGYDATLVSHYMTDQFREEALTYVERYQKTEYFENLLTTAFSRMGLNQEQRTRLTILDVGSGAGNSVLPLLKLCPASFVIASDLSAELLVCLRNFLHHQRLQEKCLLLQLNAEELNFAERTFDLVVGAAALHHLFSPEKTIAGCAQILKKGGYAIFFEPFENGHALLSLAYRHILKEERSCTLTEASKNFLRGKIYEYDLRKGRDKSRPELVTLDDKWFFTRQYFWELADRYHFSQCIIYPLYPLELTKQQFVLQTEINLRLALGRERDALPEWAWHVLQEYDEMFSEDFKKEALLEGTIILRK